MTSSFEWVDTPQLAAALGVTVQTLWVPKPTYIHKSHNVSILLYHLVCPAKYRRVVFDPQVDAALRDVCLEISQRYEIIFLEIGTDGDHVHFLMQSVPSYSPLKIVGTLKSIVGREMFKRCPHVKKKLWGGEFWSHGYFVATVGQHGNAHTNAHTIANSVREQGTAKEYQQLHAQPLDTGQLALFDDSTT